MRGASSSVIVRRRPVFCTRRSEAIVFRTSRRRTKWGAAGAPRHRACVEAESERGAAVARIDEAVVPEPRGGEEGGRFPIVVRDDPRALRLRLLRVEGKSARARRILGDDRHHLGRLLAAHHRNPGVRPGKQEARPEGPPAHAVMAGAERAADLQGQLRHAGVGDRLDHLRAVLDDARGLGLDADEIAGGVLQKDDRQAGLAAELDELPRLARAGGIDRTVVADQPDRSPSIAACPQTVAAP